MITLKYSKNSWHSLLWESTYAEELPISMCTYFWKLLLAIVLFIPSWIGHLVNVWRWKANKDMPVGARMEVEAIFTVTHLPLIMLVGGMTLKNSSDFNFLVIYGKGWIITLIIAVLMLSLYGFYYLVKFLSNKIFSIKKKNAEPKSPNPIIVGVKSFFGKYCPKIEWL